MCIFQIYTSYTDTHNQTVTNQQTKKSSYRVCYLHRKQQQQPWPSKGLRATAERNPCAIIDQEEGLL